MPQNLRGVPFHGEFSSADASALTEANSRFALEKAGFITSGSTIALAATDIVVVLDAVITVGATGLSVWLYDGANNVVDAGEQIAKVFLLANTTVYSDFTVGHYCAAGTYPKVKSSGAGQVDVTINGTIVTVNP